MNQMEEFWRRYHTDAAFHLKVDAIANAAACAADACHPDDSCYAQKVIAAREALRLWYVGSEPYADDFRPGRDRRPRLR